MQVTLFFIPASRFLLPFSFFPIAGLFPHYFISCRTTLVLSVGAAMRGWTVTSTCTHPGSGSTLAEEEEEVAHEPRCSPAARARNKRRPIAARERLNRPPPFLEFEVWPRRLPHLVPKREH